MELINSWCGIYILNTIVCSEKILVENHAKEMEKENIQFSLPICSTCSETTNVTTEECNGSG